jgi:hypothetical protein
MKNIIPLFILILSINYASAQETISISDVTDQLGRTKSSMAIPKGTLLTNLNYTYSEASTAYTNRKRHNPKLNLGYGLGKRVDIRLETEYSFEQRTEDFGWNWGNLPHTRSYKGLDGFKLGSKVNLFEQKGWIPQVAFSAEFVVGYSWYGDDIDRFNDENGIILSLPWSYNLGQKFRLSGGFEYMHLGTRRISNIYNGSINGRYEIIEDLGVFVELMVPTNFTYYSVTPTVGAFYRINSNMQVDLSFGKYIGNYNNYFDYERSYLSGGFSWLIFNN